MNQEAGMPPVLAVAIMIVLVVVGAAALLGLVYLLGWVGALIADVVSDGYGSY